MISSALQKCAFERLVPVERHVDRARLEESVDLFEGSAAEPHAPHLANRRAENLAIDACSSPCQS